MVCSTSRRVFGGNLRRQFYGHCLPEEPRRDSFISSELHLSEDSLLGGESSGCDFSPVYYGKTQRSHRCVISPKSDSGLRMDSEAGGLSGSVQEVAGIDRPIRNITKSPMFDKFFSLPRSHRSGNGCSSSELEWVAGVCLSPLVPHSSGSEEAPVVLWGPVDQHSSVLAPEAVVSGSSRSGGRRSGRSSAVQGSSASAPLPSVSSGGVQAVPSCLETIKRFTRAGGFSKHVAQQVSLARRPSLRAGYQTKWLVFRQWCRSKGHSISRPSLAKIADFLFWLRRSCRLSVSAVMGYRSMLSAVFKSILPEISSSPVLHDLLRSFQVESPVREVRPPSWDLPSVLNFLRSSPFEPLSSTSLRDLTRKTLLLISLATAKRVGELQALSRRVSLSSSAGLSIYFSPYHDHIALGTDALLQNWNGWQAYAFPPWSLIPAVLKKLRSSSGVLLTIIAPYWPQRPWFPDLLDLVVDGPVALPQSRDLLRQPHFHRFHLGGVQAVPSCLETIKRFTRAGGFSKHVAQQVSLARRPSLRAGYQSKWLVFRQWCRSKGHSISRPSLAKIADFLFWLRRSRRLSVSAVMGYRSMLSAVFKSILPEISSSPVLHDLLRSFQVESPVREVRPPSWDLPSVLNFLRSSPFEPLSSASLRDLTCKTLFLISLATAKRVGELQALSRRVSLSSSSAGLSYVPEFVAKTETATRPLPRSFEVQSLEDFAAGLPEDLLLCPVRSLSAYLARTPNIANRPRRLFVSPKCPSRAV